MSNKSYQLRYISVILLYFFMFILFCLYNEEYNFTINQLTFVSLIQLILGLKIINKRGFKLFSLPSLFLIVSFTFHLSHLILITLNSEVIKWYDLRGFTTSEIYIKSIVFTIKVHAFILLGILIAKKKNMKRDINNIIYAGNENVDMKIVYKIGVILFFIGIIPRLYIDLSRLFLFLNGDYLATYNLNLSGMLVVISGMVDTGIILILIGKQKNQIFCRRVFVLTLLYSILFMFTGHRLNSVITIITLLYVYFDLIKNITKKTVILYGIGGYFFVVLIGLIADIRMLGTFSYEVIIEYSIKLITSSPIFEILGEFGTSLKSVIYSISTFPTIKEHSYGVNYLKGLLLVFPNIGGFLTSIINEITYIFHFPNSAMMGGSYIGEIYYAAGEFGVIFALAIGILIGHISNKLIYARESCKWRMYAIYIVFFPNILWWSRDFFYTIVREVVWTILLIYILNLLLRNKSKKVIRLS